MSQFFGIVVRHALTAFGLQEYMTDTESAQLMGALAVIGGVLLSVLQKAPLRAKIVAFAKKALAE